MHNPRTTDANVHEEHRRDPSPCHTDPRPTCPHGHPSAVKHRTICDDCKAVVNWWKRERYRRRRAESPGGRFTDMQQLRAHLDALESAAVLISDIVRETGIHEDTLLAIRNGNRSYVHRPTSHRLLAVAVPARRRQLVRNRLGHVRRQVDATGTKRRIRCAQNEGHTLAEQAARLGWSEGGMRRWLSSSTVCANGADDVAALYPTLIAEPGTCEQARVAASRYPWARARYFSATNIDDPTYDPFRIVTKPYGVTRRLRAMARNGQGPDQVGPRINEAPETVELWLEGGPAPAYAHHLVAADYERWCFTPGPDRAIAARAVRADWGSSLAWDDLDMDSPTAHPARNKLKGFPADQMSVDSIIFDAYDGRATRFDLRPDELTEVVWMLHREGWSDRRIAVWLRWNDDGDPDKGELAVTRYRLRNGINGYGATSTEAWFESRNGLIVAPPGAQPAAA
ncbi:hypothetical protein AB0F93_03565 [Micromonospora tulbaghiae]|uniref:hypothetical protein n=1 Tax=Micromonospora tulbaghiae TaxID=479978 RepID=UPI003327464D